MDLQIERAAISEIKLELNMDKIFRRHLDDVGYMLTMGKDIKMWSEIVNSPEVSAALGDVGALSWKQWLDLMARKGGQDSSKRIAAIDFIRRNMGSRGWIVTFAGTAINLALGILYTWSIFKGAIRDSIVRGGEGAFRWDLASINDPYAVCCLVFAFAMVIAGKCQDWIGPRITALVGALLVGAGFIWISQTTSYWAWVLGFGVLAVAGIGFGYSAATPPALKWFPPARTGLIAGLVVSGFGLASVYIAPLATVLLRNYGLQQAMLFFGLGFLFVVSWLAMLLKNPPKGYGFAAAPATAGVRPKPAAADHRPSEILRTRRSTCSGRSSSSVPGRG